MIIIISKKHIWRFLNLHHIQENEKMEDHKKNYCVQKIKNHRESQKRYINKNKEMVLIKNREYARKNRRILNKKQRKYYQKNRDTELKRFHQYYIKNKGMKYKNKPVPTKKVVRIYKSSINVKDFEEENQLTLEFCESIIKSLKRCSA